MSVADSPQPSPSLPSTGQPSNQVVLTADGALQRADLERLAELVLEKMRRELVLENEREGRRR